MNLGERKVARLKWQAHCMESENIKNVNETLIQLFLATIGEIYKNHLEFSFIGRVNRTTSKNFSRHFCKSTENLDP